MHASLPGVGAEVLMSSPSSFERALLTALLGLVSVSAVRVLARRGAEDPGRSGPAAGSLPTQVPLHGAGGAFPPEGVLAAPAERTSRPQITPPTPPLDLATQIYPNLYQQICF